MRNLVAWLLLSLLSFYWIGGQLLHQITISYEIKLERSMSQEEQHLSQRLHSNTGVDRSVLIIQDDDIDLSGIGYSGTFVFNEIVDGSPVYYIVETSQSTTVVKVNKNFHTPIGGHDDSISFEHLFPKYFNSLTATAKTALNIVQSENFSQEICFHSVVHSVPTPPPRLG